MNRFCFRFAVIAIILILFFIPSYSLADPELQYQLLSETGEEVAITTVNQKRESDSLVLYTPDYGKSTRTNPYGIEVYALSVPGSTYQFKVEQVSSIWECQKQNDLAGCGNMSIPSNGIVLSASGNKRDALLKLFSPGGKLVLNQIFYYQSSFPIDVVNPTAETNPIGSSFPGLRGGNQMIVYDFNSGQAVTGTNEFGFEVTVVNNRVVAQEGSNSAIPFQENSFILSGHGKAARWLIKNAVPGSRIEIKDNMILSSVDRDTYLYQLDKIVAKTEELKPGIIPADLKEQIDLVKNRSFSFADKEFAQKVMALKSKLIPVLWTAYPSILPDAPRAIWHRPSESSLEEIRQSLDMIKKAGFNTLYLETYLHGNPIFPSQTFKRYNIPIKLPFETKDNLSDLLKVWIDEAHQRDIKVHAWFQTFYAGNLQYDKTCGDIINTYPSWANVQLSGLGKTPLPPSTLEGGAYFLDPANQEVQNFLLALIQEIIANYPIDGLQLDYIRYPSSFPPDKISYAATTWGYTDTARNIFKSRTGYDPVDLHPEKTLELWREWNRFKARQVDRFVQKVHELVKTEQPDLPLSAAIFPKPGDALGRKQQDWLKWSQNGWIDFIVPMTLTSSSGVISSDTQIVRFFSALPVVTGVFGPFNGNSPTDVIEQVRAAITAGAKGVALFDTAHLTQKMAEALRAGVFGSSTEP